MKAVVEPKVPRPGRSGVSGRDSSPPLREKKKRHARLAGADGKVKKNDAKGALKPQPQPDSGRPLRRMAKEKGTRTVAKNKGDGGNVGKGRARRKQRDGAQESERVHSHRTKVSARTRFWTGFGEPGNAFLRNHLGGAGVDSKSGWEYNDIAKAIGKAEFESIQTLYDLVASEVAMDRTYVDVADTLRIPQRAFIIATLLKGFDDLIAKNQLKPWKPPNAGDGTGHNLIPDVSLDAHTDFVRADTPPLVDPNVVLSSTSKNKNNKTWKEIQNEAKRTKTKSSTCSIM